MEVAALKGSGGDVQHCRSYYRRAWRPLWPRGIDPNLGQHKALPERTLDKRDAGGRMSVPVQTQNWT